MPEKATTASIDGKTPTDRIQRKRGQRVEQIVRTAAALFGERGFDAVSLEDVAEQLDVTKGSLYYYFASKEELGTAAIETLGNDWVARLRDTASEDFESTTARLYAVVREHIAIAVTEYPAIAMCSRTTDRKRTRLNSSHVAMSYAGVCVQQKSTMLKAAAEP